MNKLLLIICSCLFFVGAFAFNPQEAKLSKVGEGTLSYLFWDVYVVRYYKSDKVEALELEYLRDVERKYSIKGWKQGLENEKNIDKELEWLISHAVDIKEGDKLRIYKYEGENVLISKNGKTIAKKLGDKKLYRIVHMPWIGPEPVDSDLKKALLKSES